MTVSRLEDHLYTIRDLVDELDRSETTIRNWCRSGRLPEPLRPARKGDLGWRYWTSEQVEGIREWMVEQRMFPGGGLAHYNPSPAEVEQTIGKLRNKSRQRGGERRAEDREDG
jgi:hypothetical protein